jgi:hypothetical protein
LANTLIFLGSGASVPFGVPTMRGLVESFEIILEEESEPNSIEMYKLYQSVKKTLLAVYGYVDLESIFSVIDDLAKNITYSELGFTSVYILSKFITAENRSIIEDNTKTIANDLLVRFKDFVRKSCTVDNNEDSYIKEVFGCLFRAIASKANRRIIATNEKKKIPYEKWPIYTTNYDRVQELCWEGIAEINDLVREENGMSVIKTDNISEPSLKLIKIHGSLDWYKLEDGTVVKSNSSRI